MTNDLTRQKRQSLTGAESLLSASDNDLLLDLWSQLNKRLEVLSEKSDESLPDHSLYAALIEASTLSSASNDIDTASALILKKMKSVVSFDDGQLFLQDDYGTISLSAQILDSEINGINKGAGDLDHVSKALLEETLSTGQITTARADGPDGSSLFALCLPVGDSESRRGGILVRRAGSRFEKGEVNILDLFALLFRIMMTARLRQASDPASLEDNQVVESAPFGIVVLSSSGDLISINNAALEVFELDQSDILPDGQDSSTVSFFALLPEKERSRWRYMINSAGTCYDMFEESRYVHDTGYMEKVLSVRILALAHAHGNRERVVIYVEDVTEKTVMDKYIILSEKLAARGEMADTVAHKLNNLLAVVGNHGEMAEKHLSQKQFEKAAFNLQSLLSATLKMRLYVETLTDFSRPPIEFISFDIKSLIEDLLFSFRRTKKFHNVHFTIDLNQDIPNLEIDVSQIQELLTSLLDNATEATFERAMTEDAHGQTYTHSIGVSADYDEKQETITLRVTDNGAGMSDDILKKALLLHFTTRPAHHGIGLHNCKRIVKQHNGRISIASTPSKGTEVTIVLPRFQPRAARR